MQEYTSKELSKVLHERGFERDHKYCHTIYKKDENSVDYIERALIFDCEESFHIYPAYSLLSIMTTHAKELFGEIQWKCGKCKITKMIPAATSAKRPRSEGFICSKCKDDEAIYLNHYGFDQITPEILSMLQQGEDMDVIDRYIIKHLIK